MKEKAQSWGVALLFVLIAVIVSSCRGQVAVESDSDQSYAPGSFAPLDHNYYVIKGTVIGDVRSLVMGQAAGRVSVTTVGPVQPSGVAVSSTSGTYFPGGIEGKGFIRLSVEDTTPDTALAPDGENVLVKTTDTKAIALLPGDYIVLICRAQFEAVAAIDNQEKYDEEKAGTWEIDYCRLRSPVISNAKGE